MSQVLHSISRRSFLAASAAAGALVLLHPFSARAQANQAHLRIMETTDIHVNVLPYDYYADKPNDTMGLPHRFADRCRAQGGHQRHVDRQWRSPAGQPDGRLHRL